MTTFARRLKDLMQEEDITQIMLARISKLVERYMADAELGHELKVLNDKEYADKQRAYKLMRSTLEDAETY